VPIGEHGVQGMEVGLPSGAIRMRRVERGDPSRTLPDPVTPPSDHSDHEKRPQHEIDGQPASVNGISSGQPSVSSPGSPTWTYCHRAHGCSALWPRWSWLLSVTVPEDLRAARPR